MTPEATRDEVVAALRSLGLRASHEFPGYISIPANDGAEYAVGSMNGPWQIDHKTLGGDVTSLDGHLPEDRAAPEVAIWIKQSIAAGDRPEAPPPAAWATASSPVAEGTQRGRRDDVKQHRLKAIRKRWNKMDKQVEAAKSRRVGTNKKPSKGMRRFHAK